VSDWLPNPLQTRQSIIDALRRCAIGEWYYVNEFTEYIKKYTTDFMRPDGNYERWAPRDANSDHPLRGYESWEYVEGAYIRFVISGPLVWLGILELHSSGIDTVADDVFRLTTAGGALLELCDPPLFKIPPRIAILSGGLIDVPSRRRYERYQLSRIAQFAQPGNIVRFRVTPSSLNRALQQRITLARIVNFLEQATERPLPPYLKTAIENHYRDNKGASLEHLWVLRLPDPEHKAVSALQNFIQEQLTPNIVTIAERDLDRVIAILSENGLLTDIREV
jgi:hypothetical protein